LDKILQDFTKPALTQAIEANLGELYGLFQNLPGAEVHRDEDMLWCITDNPFSFFNGVLSARLAPGKIDDAIEKAKSRCNSRSVSMLWWVGPSTKPADLGAHLAAHGFEYLGDEQGMAVDLRSLDEDYLAAPGLIIEKVNDLQALKHWGRVFTAGFDWPVSAGETYFDLFNCAGLDAELPLYHYLGWLNGAPAACSSMLFGAGVAGIYNVATLPEARGRGIGASMTLAPLHEARRMGYTAGILQATGMGAGLYRRLGFQEYCKIGLYEWPPS
jgi:GNAT superfamily N-acetyltransferase